MFSRVAWQIRSRTGTGVYAWLPTALAGGDPEKASELYAALARSVPFDGAAVDPVAPYLSDLFPISLRPGVSRWDPRTPRWTREAQDRARLPQRTRLALGVLDAVTRYHRDLGWQEGDHWGRLAYISARGVPAEWRRVQRTGLLNSVYCPDRLLDRDRELTVMSAIVGGATFPFRP
jgi:hypothetical protein